MSNLDELGKPLTLALEPDEEGYVGRQCPLEECRGYFKITVGTGIQEPGPCRCPYCGHSEEPGSFLTEAQREYLLSVAWQRIAGALAKDLKALEFDHKPKGMFGIGISLKVTESSLPPIRYYREEKLETHVVCDACTLRYAIFGVFGWCPDCGIHNSLQILLKNLELAKKEIALTESLDTEFADYLTGDALENIVSAFDGFGREVCAQENVEIRFQNLVSARARVKERFDYDFASGTASEDWNRVCRVFLKRHLLAHKMGVVDQEYLDRANDPSATLGHKIRIDPDEVRSTARTIEILGRSLFDGILRPKK
jgi:hypothetical protein